MYPSIKYEQAKAIFDAVVNVAKATPGVKVVATSRGDEYIILRADGVRGKLMLWGERDKHMGAERPARVTWECEQSWVALNDYGADKAPHIVLNIDPEDLPSIRTDD